MAQVNIRDSVVQRTEEQTLKEEEERQRKPREREELARKAKEERTRKAQQEAEQRKIEQQRAIQVSGGLAVGRGTDKAPDENLLVQKATLLIRDGNYPPAISLLKKAVALDPGNMEIESMLREAKKAWGQILIRQNY